LAGAIEPLTGKHFQQEYPKLNGEYFQKFWTGCSGISDDYAILQIDQAPAEAAHEKRRKHDQSR